MIGRCLIQKWFLSVLCWFLVLGVFIGPSLQVNAKSEWPTALPEEVGMDSGSLAEMFDYVRKENVPVHSVQIVRNGKLVLDAYFYPFRSGLRHDVASVTKSITSTLTGIATDRGLLAGVKEPVLGLFAGQKVALVDERKEKLLVEHLLTMEAGWDCGFEPNEGRLFEMRGSADWIQFMLDLPMVAEPGTRWAYCSGNCHVISALISRVTGTNELGFARQELFGPLGISDVRWAMDSAGNNHGWGDLQMLPIDMAKIGQLFLQFGEWNGRRIVSEAWIKEATGAQVEKTSNKDHYGYFWWVKGEPFVGMFEAVGRGGQRINVWPEKNLVLVFTGGEFEPGDLAGFILKALQSDRALPSNAVGVSRLKAQVAAAKNGPLVRSVKALPVLAERISGRTFELSTNALGWSAMTLTFNKSAETELDVTWNGQRERFPVGLDGVERFANNTLVDLPTAARGDWINENTFHLELNLVAAINFYDVTLTFPTEDSVSVVVKERTGLNREKITGVRQ
jgi:CubicO group peptidase (beta-lactamase class C family)